MDTDTIFRILRAFETSAVRYKVVGGVALNFVGLPRATQDLDIFVDPTEDNIARLRLALKSIFADPEIDGILASDLAGEYPAVQYVPPSGVFHIDILARLGEAFGYADIEIEERIIEGIAVAVATPRMLIRMKEHTVRPQDHADAARLRKKFAITD